MYFLKVFNTKSHIDKQFITSGSKSGRIGKAAFFLIPAKPINIYCRYLNGHQIRNGIQ